MCRVCLGYCLRYCVTAWVTVRVNLCMCYCLLLDASVIVWVNFHVTVSLLLYICRIFLVTVLLSVCYCL